MTQRTRFSQWLNGLSSPAFVAFYVIAFVAFDALMMVVTLLGKTVLIHIGWMKTGRLVDWSDLSAFAVAAFVLACWAVFDRNRKLAKLGRPEHEVSGR